MNTSTRSRVRVVALACAVAMVLVACGGDGASTSIEATVRDFEFEPTSWTVAAGEEITLELTNDAAIEHEFVILKKGVEVDDETELPETEEELLSDFIYWEAEAEAGETVTVTFTAPEAGTYEVICAIEGHLDAGMRAELISE